MNDAFNIDFTFLIITLLVAVLYLILRRVFFDPLGKIFQERGKIKNEHQKELDYLTGNIDQIKKKMEGALNKAKNESIELNQKLIKESKRNHIEIIKRSKEESKELFKKMVKQMNLKLKRAEENISEKVKKFSNQLIKKIK